MVLGGSRGYVFTLVMVMMVMVILSLMLFYTQISSPTFEDDTSQMSVNELHYFVESVKSDASRAISISGERAGTYAVEHVIATNETFESYSMEPCRGFNYSGSGPEAALAELMVCGSLSHTQKSAGDVGAYMENNTVGYWLNAVNEGKFRTHYTVRVDFRNMSIALIDAWHYAVVSELDMYVYDNITGNTYKDSKVPVASYVDVSTLEDPLVHVKAGTPVTLQILGGCSKSYIVDGSVLDGWVESGCFNSAAAKYEAPSFFDRLEGGVNLNPDFVTRSNDMVEELGLAKQDLGLESMVNIELLEEYNVSVSGNLSQVDHMYWKGVGSVCGVDGMVRHPDFRIDVPHAVKYGVVGLDCQVSVENVSGGVFFNPTDLNVPPGASITWVDKTGKPQKIHTIYNNLVPSDIIIPPLGTLKVQYNNTGVYVTQGVDGEIFTLQVIDYSA